MRPGRINFYRLFDCNFGRFLVRLKREGLRIKIILTLLMATFDGVLIAAPKVDSKAETYSLSSLIQLALGSSLDHKAAISDVKLQEASEKSISRGRLVPQMTIAASFQSYSYERAFEDSGGRNYSNNGHNSPISLTVSYDLQKLFSTESDLANQATHYSQLQEKIVRRDIIRTVKKSYFSIVETKAELEVLNELISLFSRIEAILQKQKKIGIYNELERQQFKVQESILESDLQNKKGDLDFSFAQLASITNNDVTVLKTMIESFSKKPDLHFGSQLMLDPDALSKVQEKNLLELFGRDYNIGKLEYDQFSSVPLPSIFVKGSREAPTMASSDGPQTVAEIGISIPIDGFFTRATQKTQLEAKFEKNKILFEKSLFELDFNFCLKFS